MNQTLALLIDAYRDLNARKLFWITLALSGLIMGAFAFVGVGQNGLTFAGMHLFRDSLVDPMTLYKIAFNWLVMNLWVTWGAIGLAIISTAGIFPDLISSGTIDLYLSKPLSRLRLFFIKYLTGLLFVAGQVTVFALVSFIVVGLRTGEWRPGLFLTIPLVVCMFSYLYGFCALIGVWTRSTVAAILLTVLFWLLVAMVQTGDQALANTQILLQHQIDRAEHVLANGERELASAPLFSIQSMRIGINLKNAREQLPEMQATMAQLRFFRRLTFTLKTIVPKTGETISLFDRVLFRDEEVAPDAGGDASPDDTRPLIAEKDHTLFGADEQAVKEAGEAAKLSSRRTSPWYIVGTSLACEAVMVAAAAWIFCRRDY